MSSEILELTEHVVVRYHERVRPAMTIEQAEDDLAHQLENHGRWGEPDWLSPSELAQADRWLMIGNDIGFAVRGPFLMTCFVRSTYGPRRRRLATDKNHYARRARRAKERPEKQRWERKLAKRSGKRDRGWEAS